MEENIFFTLDTSNARPISCCWLRILHFWSRKISSYLKMTKVPCSHKLLQEGFVVLWNWSADITLALNINGKWIAFITDLPYNVVEIKFKSIKVLSCFFWDSQNYPDIIQQIFKMFHIAMNISWIINNLWKMLLKHGFHKFNQKKPSKIWIRTLIFVSEKSYQIPQIQD